MKPARFLPAAREEFLEAVDYYDLQSPHLGASFRLSIEQTVDVIREYPAAWPEIRPGFRHKLLRRFPYGVIYREEPTEIAVVAVMHLSREPDYWAGRE